MQNSDTAASSQRHPFAFFLVIFLLLAVNFAAGIEKGLDHSLPGARPRQIEYIAAAISATVYGIKGYLYSELVHGTLLRGGMADPADTSESGLIAHFTNANALNNAIAAAVRLPPAAVRGSPMVIMGTEDLAYIEFLKLSYDIFGVRFASAYYGYSLVIGLSIAIFLLFPVCSPALTTLSLSVFLIAHLALMNTMPNLGYEFLTVTNARFFNALSLLPLLYLACAIFGRVRIASRTMVGVVLQSFLLAFTLLVRLSGIWTIMFLVFLLGLLAVDAHLARKRTVRTANALGDVGAPIGYFRAGASVLILVVVSWGGMKALENLNTSPQYALQGGITTHLIWHNAFVTLASQPDLQEIIAARYPNQHGDQLGFVAVVQKLREEGVPESEWRAPPGVSWPAKPLIYEKVIRGLYFDLLRAHPLWVLENYVYYEPNNVEWVLKDAWKRGVERQAVQFVPIVTVIGLIILMRAARVPIRTVIGAAALTAVAMVFAAAPSLFGGAAAWLLGEALILSVCFFYLVVIALVMAVAELTFLLIKASRGERAPPAPTGGVLAPGPAEGGGQRFLAYNVITFGLVLALVGMQFETSRRASRLVVENGVLAAPTDIAAEMDNIILPAACQHLPSFTAAVSPQAPVGRHLIVGDGVNPKAVRASSQLSPGVAVEGLFGKNPDGIWHIEYTKSWPVEWVLMDLGVEGKASVDDIRMMPRPDGPSQFLTTSCLLGSDDGESWTGIAELDSPALRQANWVEWQIPSSGDFRFYKLVIPNEVPSQFHTFYSIGKLELYH